MGKKASKLTPKRKAFCHEYLKDMNATHAAIRAGFAEKSASAEGARLLADVKVQEYLGTITQKKAEKLDLSVERTLNAIAEIAFGDIRNMFDEDGNLLRPDKWTDEVAASIAGVEYVTEGRGEGAVEYVAKVKRADRLKALDMLARYHALYTDNLNVNVNGSLAERLNRAKARLASGGTLLTGAQEGKQP